VPRGLNKVLLVGEVGRDPEMRFTPQGVPVTTFSLGASRSWVAPDGDEREATEWFNVVAWHELAETCSRELRRGQRVYVEGRIQTRSWLDPEGQARVATEIVADDAVPLGEGVSRPSSADTAEPASDQQGQDG
jgi:single-strand DNA-binding protein